MESKLHYECILEPLCIEYRSLDTIRSRASCTAYKYQFGWQQLTVDKNN